MRNYTLLVLAVIILANSSFSQDGWKVLQPDLTNRELFQISFIDNSTGYFLGDSVIIKTKDGGDNWEKLNTPPSYPYISFFTDEDMIWLSSGEGKIFNSSDGGTSWQEIFSSEKILRNIYFQDNDTGWAIGDYKFIMHSSDGGENWEVQYTYEYDSLFTLSFTDNKSGWCGKDMKTTDGGLNWIKYSTNLSYSPRQIKFFDNQTGISLSGSQGYKVLYKTTNGGTDWDTLFAPLYSVYISSLEVIDSINLYLFAYHEYPASSIMKSSNGGYAWEYIYYLEHQEMYTFINSIAILSDSTIFCNVASSGNGSYIFRKKTQDHNFLMSNRLNGYWLRDIHAFNKDTVITGGAERWSDYGGIFKTYDRGKTWHKKYIPLNYGISRLLFINNKGFALCDTLYQDDRISKILGSTDAGESWSINYENPTGLKLNDIFFLNDLLGFISASGGKILKTIDGGNTWSEISIAEPSMYFKSIFFHENTGWIAGNPSFKTTDGGNSWFPISVIPNKYGGFYFKNELEGNAAQFNTTDGGNSWYGNSHNWYGNDYFPSVAYDQGILYLTADGHNNSFNYGALFKSSDFGASWDTLIHYIFHKPLQSVKVHNGIGWACGYHGQILFRDSAFILSDENEFKGELVDYSLSQNYPNPFNPSTTIKYSIKDFEFVNIRIYDILGREMITLINEYKFPGSYEINFNAAGLSSGVYFYKISAGGYNSVKKLQVIK